MEATMQNINVTLAAIKEARTEEAAGTIDTSSYDNFVNSILS